MKEDGSAQDHSHNDGVLGLLLLAFMLPQPIRHAFELDKLLWIVVIVSFVLLAGLIWARFRRR